MLRGIGVRGRLLLAFFGISCFAVLGAVAGLISFAQVGSTFDRITRERMPASFAALELSRQTERIASVAPVILSDKTQLQQMRTDRRLRKELTQLDKLLVEVRRTQPNRASLSDIESSISAIRRNLAQLQEIVALHPRAGPSNPGRYADIDPTAWGEQLLRNNREASERLAEAVDVFISEERAAIDKAGEDVFVAQRRGTAVLVGAVVLSLVGSALFAWLYVGRNIVARLAALNASMLAVAGGNLEAPLPSDSGKDEIGRMADALRTFRDTALESERLARLKRFLAPQLAELIVSSGDERVLESHRRDVAVLFCDLRGFTAFAETAEPEEVMKVLREYHTSLGQLVHDFGGTLERFTGDGMIVLFNDPLPCPEPSLMAAQLSVEMRARVDELVRGWRLVGSRLGFGIGIAYGYATLGRVGYEGRFDYTAIGSVVNLAARLCERANAGEILLDSKVYAAIGGRMKAQSLGEFTPKGFSRPIEVFNLGHQDDSDSGLAKVATFNRQPGSLG
jgi:class 3 adenylate cyclase